MPVFWNTNAVPQMRAVRMSRPSALMVEIFMRLRLREGDS
jgi:hypothetical protein